MPRMGIETRATSVTQLKMISSSFAVRTKGDWWVLRMVGITKDLAAVGNNINGLPSQAS